jgi:hypothetical protein
VASTAEGIKTAATAATVPETSWGLLGQALTYGDYVELPTGFLEHLDKIVEKLANALLHVERPAGRLPEVAAAGAPP